MPQESKLTSFFSKKSKAQSPSVLTVVTEQSTDDTDQQSTAVALETKVTKHFDSLEPFVTLTDSTPITENVFPDVWTTDQWAQKKKDYPWLDCRDGKLGCKICKKVALSIHTQQGVSIAVEWKEYTVSYYGDSLQSKLTSLRKKISRHKDSMSHITASKICSTAEKQTIEKEVDTMNEADIAKTEKVLRTAYFLAKEDRPFSDHPHLLELQQMNGVHLGIGLRSRFTATNMVDHIATDMRKCACDQIRKVEGNISILIDESTTLSNKSALIVYLKCQSTMNGEPHFMFLDLIELADQCAKTIFESLIRCLAFHGFDDDYLRNHLVAFASDGASVMLGRNSGVASMIVDKYPIVIVWHCLNHRLELAVSNAIKEVTVINHFQAFFDKLYSIYSRSPKNQHELDGCAEEIGQQLRKIGRIFGVRWVSSSYRTVSAVWKNYQSLCMHFENASCDTHRNSQDRASFLGLLKRIRSPEFVVDLGLMHDALHELSSLSLLLQERGTSLLYADKLIHRSIRVLETMRDKHGIKTREAMDAAEKLIFRGITLAKNNKLLTINHKQFFTSLVNNMQARLFTTQSSHVSSDHKKSNTCKQQYEDLMQQFGVLDETTWPSEIPPGFGEDEVTELCTRFSLPRVLTVNAFRDYVDGGGRRMPADLKPLVNCTRIIPCSTAECERGFSHMNIIVSDTRSKLLVSHVSSLMFIKLHGPPLRSWNPTRYAKTWLRKHRSAMDTQTRVASLNPSEDKTEDPLWQFL